MEQLEIARRRLHAQRLAGGTLATPADVARHLGAVQAQDWPGAKWAIARRCPGVTSASLDADLAAGRLLRTHVLRPTWHVVAPEDLRDWLALTAPRIVATSVSYQKQLGVDEALIVRAMALFAEALAGGAALTRAQLGAVVTAAGLEGASEWLGVALIRAELAQVLVSGGMSGKQFTYMAFDQRVPASAGFDRPAALKRLATAYFTSHGPATVPDFAWWSGLTQADAKAGLKLAGDAVEQVAEGLYAGAGAPDGVLPAPCMHLLPNYDELVVGHQDRGAAIDPASALRNSGRDGLVFSHLVTRDGRAVAPWKREIGTKGAKVALQGAPALSAEERAGLEAEVARYGAFLGLPAALV